MPMNLPSRLLLAASLCLSAFLPAAPSPSPWASWDGAALNRMARYLAGIEAPQEPAAPELPRDSAFTEHVRAMQGAWQVAQGTRFTPMRAWSARELGALAQTPRVFYPFSGPDGLHVRALFPWATDYVLCGLEKVGGLPELRDLNQGNRGKELACLRKSVHDSLAFSFFRTLGMREDLRNHALTGVLPILLAYAAAQGDPLQSVECLDLTDQGTLEPTQGHPRAVRITFAAQGDPRPRTLTYFSLDLSNPGLQSRTGQAFLAFLGSRGRSITYLKSASYLLHGQGFSTVRAFILQHSLAVLQDDSGIPHHFFGAGAWTFLPYGRYEGPIPMFKAFEQKDLRAGFHAGSPRPLGFGIGYKFRGTASNLELYQAH